MCLRWNSAHYLRHIRSTLVVIATCSIANIKGDEGARILDVNIAIVSRKLKTPPARHAKVLIFRLMGKNERAGDDSDKIEPKQSGVRDAHTNIQINTKN